MVSLIIIIYAIIEKGTISLHFYCEDVGKFEKSWKSATKCLNE